MGMVPTCDVRSTAPRYSSYTKYNYYYERSELLIDGDGKKSTQKKDAKKHPKENVRRTQRNVHRSFRRAMASSVCRSSGVRRADTDPSGERQ